MSAIDLLLQQHQQVEGLFQKFKAGGEDRIQLIGRIAEALTLHAVLEEQYVYPMLKQHGMDEDFDRSEEEHAEVKQIISQLLRMKQTDGQLETVMDQLISNVRLHVGLEERAVFPRLQAAADPKRLEEVGRDMEQAITKLGHQELLKMAEHQEQPVIS